LVALALASCSGGGSAASVRPADRDTLRSELTPSEILALIEKIERDPLSEGSINSRPRVFSWIIAHPSMQGLQIQRTYLRSLEESEHRYAGELVMQCAFGMAAWRLRSQTGVISELDEIEAGLRSVVAAYRAMLRKEPDVTLQFLEDLEEIIQRGKLREYIARVDAIEEGE
jgi:hypothetical protein